MCQNLPQIALPHFYLSELKKGIYVSYHIYMGTLGKQFGGKSATIKHYEGKKKALEEIQSNYPSNFILVT